jgi:hypothetical protein
MVVTPENTQVLTYLSNHWQTLSINTLTHQCRHLKWTYQYELINTVCIDVRPFRVNVWHADDFIRRWLYWCVDMLMGWWFDKMLMCWCVDDLMCWCADVMMTVLVCWYVDDCVDVLMYWWFNVLMCQRGVDIDVLMAVLLRRQCVCVCGVLYDLLCYALMYWCVDGLMS